MKWILEQTNIRGEPLKPRVYFSFGKYGGLEQAWKLTKKGTLIALVHPNTPVREKARIVDSKRDAESLRILLNKVFPEVTRMWMVRTK